MPPRTPASPPSVLLETDGDGLIVRLPDPPAAGREIAFYLLRDGERVATRWYAGDPVARFAGPLPRGRYEAQAFVRGGAHGGVERLRSAALTHPLTVAPPGVSLADAPPVVLHIGLPKTGTTYLQRTFHRALAGLPDAPLEYPEAGFYNHQVALYEPLGAHLPWKPRAGAPALWDGLSRRLATPGTRRLLLSAEALAGLDPAGIAIFRALLGGRPVERIVITTRALAKLLPSHWQQNMKQGGRGTLEAYADRILGAIAAGRSPAQMFCVAQTVRLWRAEFPQAPVAVLVMDGGQEQNLLAFADLCGLGAAHDAALLRSVPTASEQNLSFSVDECRQLIEINEAIARGQLDVAARKQAIDGFFQAREGAGDYRKPELDAARAQAAQAVDRESRAALAALPGCQWLHGRDGRQPAGGASS
ncbi:MAG: hypothetical protein KIT35_23985 [Piscinibacter sp.]|uniref:hypothetical protein n=1 Tax=Piscinibacter sp. TaxID=1903157 RepID=UPI00258A055D|nr:hypothetical protein [Piscinibacter sp.]MCW5666907.1 hypothetical protein [Piscinibacter sp.]